MVAAGLTAATPHMISASINALSRLLFEFKGGSLFHSYLLEFPRLPSSQPPQSSCTRSLRRSAILTALAALCPLEC